MPKWIYFHAKMNPFQAKMDQLSCQNEFISGQNEFIFRPKCIHFKAKINPFSCQNEFIFRTKWIHFNPKMEISIFMPKWKSPFSDHKWKIHFQIKIEKSIYGQKWKIHFLDKMENPFSKLTQLKWKFPFIYRNCNRDWHVKGTPLDTEYPLDFIGFQRTGMFLVNPPPPLLWSPPRPDFPPGQILINPPPPLFGAGLGRIFRLA